MRILRTLACASAAFLLLATPAAAQTDSAGNLETFPFDLPFDVLSASDGDVLERVVDAPFEQCVDYFQEALVSGDELSNGWTIGGQGFDVSLQTWRFGLLREGRTLYDIIVRRHARGCAVHIESDAMTLPGGPNRWAYPALTLSDGTLLAVDPYVIED